MERKTTILCRLAVLASSLPSVKRGNGRISDLLYRALLLGPHPECQPEYLVKDGYLKLLYYLLDQAAVTILVVQFLIYAYFCNFWVLCLFKSKHQLPCLCTVCPSVYLLARGLYTAFCPYGTSHFYLQFTAASERRSHVSKPNMVGI